MTDLTEVYDIFLRKINNYKLLNLTDDEIEDELFGFFRIARSKFYKCQKNLEVAENVIQSDLSYFEIEILANLMLISHITPQLVSSELLQQTLSDKDFKIYSQANQLREVRLLLDSIQSKTNKMITEYTFLDLDKGKSK